VPVPSKTLLQIASLEGGWQICYHRCCYGSGREKGDPLILIVIHRLSHATLSLPQPDKITSCLTELGHGREYPNVAIVRLNLLKMILNSEVVGLGRNK